MTNERTVLWVLAATSLLLGPGCGADEPAFLPLPDLCEAYAEEICIARQSCCQAVEIASCENAVLEACRADESALTQQEHLSYDGRRADRVRRDLRTALETCAPPLPLARFFRGGRALGQACAQSLECESQHCAADAAGNSVCTEQAASLCDLADI